MTTNNFVKLDLPHNKTITNLDTCVINVNHIIMLKKILVDAP